MHRAAHLLATYTSRKSPIYIMNTAVCSTGMDIPRFFYQLGMGQVQSMQTADPGFLSLDCRLPPRALATLISQALVGEAWEPG